MKSISYAEFIRRVSEDSLDYVELDLYGAGSKQRTNQIKAALAREGMLALYRLVLGYNTGSDYQLTIWTKMSPPDTNGKRQIKMLVVPYADKELLKIEAARRLTPKEEKAKRAAEKVQTQAQRIMVS